MTDKLNTKETIEYKEWLTLMKNLQRIQDTLKKEPSVEGLKMARSHAYNMLADIHDLLDIAENGRDAVKDIPDPLDGISFN